MISVVYGSRPEAIKLGPVVAELRALGAAVQIIATGQHTDLLKGTPAESDLADATSLGLASDGNPTRWVHHAQAPLLAALGAADLVVVQGDTMSAYAAAGAAHTLGKPLCHVEAGVRSHNLDEPWPEERYRVHIDKEAAWAYAPTSLNFANLVAEGFDEKRIRVTGNTGVSALARYTNAKPTSPSDHCLVTLHRREFVDGPHFVEVLDALCEAAADHKAARFLWPMHPTVQKRLARAWLAKVPNNLILIPPLSYAEMAGTLACSFGLISDSGGLVEEAATLGVPSVQLRNVSDRPEAIEAGVSQLEPPTRDGVHRSLQALTTGAMPRRPTDVFGTVEAASLVARHLASLDTTEVT